MTETSTETAGHEVDDPHVGDPASNVEVLNWELSDEEQTKQATELGARGVVSPVEVGTVHWAGNNTLHVASREPASKLYQ